jgi:hypothetical protein
VNQKSIRVLILASLLLLLGATQAFGQVIYDSTVTPQPGNLPSQGAEAHAFTEFGDGITFAGTARNLRTVTVTMSSFGCESGRWNTNNCVTTPGATFSQPITLNIYAAGSPAPGALIASLTQTFSIPFRPSASALCTGADAGKWYDINSGTCFNGLANNIAFDFSSSNVVLPNSVVYGIVYNTTHYGPAPIGESAACFSSGPGCPYDALNIGLAPVVTEGTKPFFNTLYQNSIVGGEYCDGGLAGTGTFRLDSPTSACWAGFIPAAQFFATTVATTKQQCKNDGWQSLTRADGSSFKNQGDCIQYVNTGR